MTLAIKKQPFTTILLLLLATALSFSACKKEQARYDELTQALEGNWKIMRITTASEVFSNVGFIRFDGCTTTDDNRNCSGSVTDSLGTTYPINIQLTAEKNLEESTVFISEFNADGPFFPLSELTLGRPYTIGVIEGSTMRWVPSPAGNDFPVIELSKQ